MHNFVCCHLFHFNSMKLHFRHISHGMNATIAAMELNKYIGQCDYLQRSCLA